MAYVATRLGRWFYEDRGAPQREGDATFLLLHSLLCDGGMWRGQVGPLAALGRVVVVDGPGHGKSDVPPPFTLDENARAVADAVDRLGLGRVIVLGLSWGGMLGTRLAYMYPEKVAALVVLDSSADAPPLRERLEYRLLCAVARRVGLPPALIRKKIAPLMFGPRTLRSRPELVDELVRSVGGFSREGLVRATYAVSIDRPSNLERLRGVRAPTLVGYGEADLATPAHHSRRIATRIEGATLVPFAGVGHLSALEDPESVNAAILPFVKEHLGRRDA